MNKYLHIHTHTKSVFSSPLCTHTNVFMQLAKHLKTHTHSLHKTHTHTHTRTYRDTHTRTITLTHGAHTHTMSKDTQRCV